MEGTAFVGREEQLELLRGLLRALPGSGAVMAVLTGEAGAGKTRLLREFAGRAKSSSSAVTGRGSPLSASVPFSLFAEAIASWLRARPNLGASTDPRMAAAAAFVPGILAERETSGPDGVNDVVHTRLATLEGFAAILTRMAADGPLLVILDDIHQADPSTIELLDYLGRNPLDAPVLIVAAARTTDLSPHTALGQVVSSLGKDGLLSEIRLPPLEAEDVASLAETALGAGVADQKLVDWLVERARGNALYTVALLSELAGDPGRRVVPMSVKERVRATMAALPAPTRQALEVASVLGTSFSHDALASFADEDERSWDGIDDLVELGFLEIPLPGGNDPLVYGFAHPLVQEAIYESLGETRRRELHRSVAARGANEPLSVRAYHAARGARTGDAESIALTHAAAREAEENQSHREALTHLRAALSLVPTDAREQRIGLLKEIAWQAGAASDHPIGIPALRELETLVASDSAQLGAVKIQLASFVATGTGDLPEAERLAREAVSLFEETGLTEYVPGALNELAWIRGEEGDLESQVAGSREALRLVREVRSNEAQPLGHLGHGLKLVELHSLGPLGHGLSLLGHTEEAVETGRTGLAMAEATGEREQIGWHAGALSSALVHGGRLPEAAEVLDRLFKRGPSASDVAYTSSAWLNWLLGRWTPSLADCRAVQAMHPTAPSIHSGWTLSLAGLLLTSMGHEPDAKPLLGMADRLYGERDFYIFSAYHRWAAGCSARLMGDATLGRTLLARALDWLQGMGAIPLAVQLLPDLVETELALGEADAATARVRWFADPVAKLGDPLSLTGLRYASALIAADGRKANQTDAADAFRGAAALADEAGAGFLAARALERLGQCTQDLEVLADAGRRYASLPASLHEDRVLTTLRAAGTKGARLAQQVGRLTPREEEVAALAGRGLTDRDIAGRLHVSVRTVESHLARVYAKLGIAGRHELNRPSAFQSSR